MNKPNEDCTLEKFKPEFIKEIEQTRKHGKICKGKELQARVRRAVIAALRRLYFN
jgi:hypothetical protein